MKTPWNDVRKWDVYDHKAKSSALLMEGSNIARKLLRPSKGSNTIAAFTAFLKRINYRGYTLIENKCYHNIFM